MSGSMYQVAGGAVPMGINPLTGQLVPSGANSMAPAFAPGVGQGIPQNSAPTPAAGQGAPAPLQAPQGAQLPPPPPVAPPAPQVQPQAPQGAPQAQPQAAPQGQPPADPSAPPAPPKLPSTPYTPYAANIAHYESGGGQMVGNGGGALQFEPAEQKAFEAANPQFAGTDHTAPAYQGAAYSWLTTQNAATLAKTGVDATAPGVNYAAFALGAPAAAALASAKDPTADATSFVSNMKNGDQIIKGNPALFAGGATINDVFNRAQSIQTTGMLPNAVQTTSAGGSDAPGAPGSPSDNTPDPSSNLGALLDKLPNAPQLTAAKSNPWLAFASGMLGSHNLAAGFGAGLAGVNAARQGNQQSTNDTALQQQNAALQTGQAKIELGKMAAFQPVLGATSVVQGPDGPQNVMMWKNGLGEVQYHTMDGQLVKQSMQGQAEANTDAVANARMLSSNRNKTAGTGADGSYNPITPTTVQAPPGVPGAAPRSPVIPGTSIPSGAPGQPAPTGAPSGAPGQPQQPTPVPQGQGATPPADPAAAAAAPFVATMTAQAQGQNIPASLAKGYVVANQAAYDATQKAAVSATDANVAAQKALQAAQADPSAFTQSAAWNSFNNAITQKLGFSPFSGASNGNLQLSQAFIKQANAGGMGDLLHNAMGISRPSQMEVQMVQHAVANGTMPLSTLTQLMQSGINNNNSAIAEGRIAQGIWANGKFAALPGGFTSAMTTAQSNLENGKYPDLYKPMVSLPPTNAPAGGTPGAPQPGGGTQAPQGPVTLQANDTQGYAALPIGAQYIVGGNTFIKTK